MQNFSRSVCRNLHTTLHCSPFHTMVQIVGAPCIDITRGRCMVRVLMFTFPFLPRVLMNINMQYHGSILRWGEKESRSHTCSHLFTIMLHLICLDSNQPRMLNSWASHKSSLQGRSMINFYGCWLISEAALVLPRRNSMAARHRFCLVNASCCNAAVVSTFLRCALSCEQAQSVPSFITTLNVSTWYAPTLSLGVYLWSRSTLHPLNS